MRSVRRRPLLALIAAAAILGGCGTSSGMAKGPPPSPITSLASYRLLSLPPDAVRLAVATRDARVLLGGATVPPGAVEKLRLDHAGIDFRRSELRRASPRLHR